MANTQRRAKRQFTAQQKLEIVLAGLRGDKSVQDVCREHEITQGQFYQWREKLLEGGKVALAGTSDRAAERELRKKIGELERTLGKKTYELELAGKLLRGWE
jgi:transposase